MRRPKVIMTLFLLMVAQLIALPPLFVQIVNGSPDQVDVILDNGAAGYVRLVVLSGFTANFNFPYELDVNDDPCPVSISINTTFDKEWTGLLPGDTITIIQADGPTTTHFLTNSIAGGGTTGDVSTATADDIITVTAKMLGLGVMIGGLIFCTRFLWRFYQKLLGAATWTDTT